MHTILLLFVLLTSLLSACDDEAPQVAPAIDLLARSYLGTLASGNIDSIRARLNAEGTERVTPRSMEEIGALFAAGSPVDVTLLDANAEAVTADGPAERHRLIYSLRIGSDVRRIHYFFEATIAGRDTLISGFRVEPAER